MNREKELKRYSKNFIVNFEKYIRPGFSISADVYPVVGEGAVLEFKVNNENNKRVTFHEATNNLGSSLAKIKQNFIDGDLSKISFRGTNLILDNNRVIVIKGDNEQNSWSNRSILDDIKRVVAPKKEVR